MCKVKFSHTRYRALGPELIPVYRQSARRWREVNHAVDLAVGCRYFLPVCGYLRSYHQMLLPVNGSTHLIPAYYSFIDPERMKGWVGLVGWPVADVLPTLVVTHQLQVEHRTGKVCQSETDVLPLCHATNWLSYVFLPSVLWRCWLGGRKGIWPVKNRVVGAGVVICLEQGADLHMAQLIPLPLTLSCFSKIQIGFTFLVPAHPGSPGKRAVKRVCMCVLCGWAAGRASGL